MCSPALPWIDEGGLRTYHRVESATQSPDVALAQQATGEIQGRAPRLGLFPAVEAFPGPLPAGKRGIEFETDVPPDPGCPPTRVYWRGPRPGVTVEGDVAKISVRVTKNSQQ